jgi:hypothetical protein
LCFREEIRKEGEKGRRGEMEKWRKGEGEKGRKGDEETERTRNWEGVKYVSSPFGRVQVWV